MSDNKKHGSFAGKGYYIALILCAAAIGITGYVYYREEAASEQVLLQEQTLIPVATWEAAEDVEALATEPAVQPTAASTVPATQPEQKKILKTCAPVAGEEIYGYSMETLSYNETTRDWRVHNGIDIAAEEGTAVMAAADGTVLSVTEEDTMGYSVVIRHDGGYTTCYASLQENVAVEPGDAVTVGQTIGYIGSSALLETALGSHLHFSVACQDVPMDPAAFLALGQ